MHYALSDILRYTARIEDAKLKVADIFFSAETWTPQFIAVETPGWLESEQALVNMSKAGPFDSDNREVVLNTSREAIEAAPKLPGDGNLSALALTSMPDALGGPMMRAADMRLTVRDDASDPAAEAIERRFERTSHWIGMGAFGSDGELGRVDDLLVDDDTGRISHIVIDNAASGAGRQLVVPIETVSHVADGHSHVVLRASSEMLMGAPQIETLDNIDRHWIDAVRTYYQLPI